MQKFRYTDNQKKAHDLNRHISVTAGAGSGKTAVLVNRYLKILLEKDARVRNVVAITFTEKAAAELKNRITEKINELIGEEPYLRVGDVDLKKLRSIKEQLTSANISTIHSFCSRILREFAVEARVDAAFRIIHGIERRMLLGDVIDETLKNVAMQNVGNPQREKLANLLRVIGQDKLKKMLALLAGKRYEVELLKRDLYESSDSELIQFWQDFVADEFHKLIDHFSLDRLIDALNGVLTIAKGKKATYVSDLAGRLQEAGYSQMEIANDLANSITTGNGSIAKRDFIGLRVKTSGFEPEIELLCDFANEIKKLPIIDHADEDLIKVTREMLEFYDLVAANYEKAKIQSGQLDFEDLQLRVKNLLEEDASIRKRLAEKYPYIMIDEYQDTNRLQYNILKPLVEDYQSGNLFIVGDPKQSIYGFRNADVRVFDQTKGEITDYQKDLSADFVWNGMAIGSEENEQQGELHLADSFRSLRDVVGFVNLVFEDVMDRVGAKQLASPSEFDVDYVPLIKGRQNNEAAGSVELILLPKKKRKGFESDTKTESQHEIIAERIKQLIASEYLIWERSVGEEPYLRVGEETARPIKYQDIAILLRSRGKLPELEFALDDAGIPFKIAGGIGFYQRQEIYDIYNYLQFLLNPHDDIALAGILRGPFFGISDAELYEIANCNASSGSALESPTEAGRPFCQDLWSKLKRHATRITHHASLPPFHPSILPIFASNILSYHLQIADRVPVPILIRDIFDRTGAIGVISAGPKGDQALGNYEKLLSVARDFERSGFSNLFDFVERLKILIEEEEREEQADIQFDKDAVQIMTVHAAKGLEFPVVILPYANRDFKYDTEPFIDDALGVGFNPADPENNYRKSAPAITGFIKERAKAKTIAEEKRIFYVAATRARDMLIISGEFPSPNSPSWMKWVCDALELDDIPDVPEIQRSVSITTLNQENGEKGQTDNYERSNRIVQDFPLRIKIIRSMSDIGEYPEIPEPTFEPEASLEINIEPIAVEPSDEIFSVSQIITYPLCPRRFYLQYRLGLMIEERGQNGKRTEWQESEMASRQFIINLRFIFLTTKGEIIHEILEQIRSPQLDKSTIDRLLRRYDGEQSGKVARRQKDKMASEQRGTGKKKGVLGEDELDRNEIIRHVENFVKSDIGKRALDAEKQYHETTINARFGKQMITGKIDLLFVNKNGQFEIVDYKSDFVTQATVESKAEEYRNQMDLYALLVHKATRQPEVDVTLFFTGLAYPCVFHYDRCSFEKIQRALKETIDQIGSQVLVGNTQHCPDCPYSIRRQEDKSKIYNESATEGDCIMANLPCFPYGSTLRL